MSNTTTMKAMRSKDLEAWKEHDDFKFLSKDVLFFRVELFYGTDRGGMILIWEPRDPMFPGLEHIFHSSDDKTKQKAGEFHYSQWVNAVYDFEGLDAGHKVIQYMWRHR